MEVLVIISAALSIAEAVLSIRWVPFYFLKGITLFKKSVFFTETPDLSPGDLTTQFSHGIANPILFHRLDENQIAFRDKAFSLKTLRYTPVMHGLISVNHKLRKISVTGHANWSALLFAIVLPAAFIADASAKSELGFVVPFLIILLGSLYAIQYFRFTRVLEAIKQKLYLSSYRHRTAGPLKAPPRSLSQK